VKATVDAKALAAAVGRVVLFLPRSAALPALFCALVEADEHGLTFTVTDIEQSVQTTCAASVGEPGRLLAPATLLSRALRHMRGEVELSIDAGMLQVVSEVGSVACPLGRVEDFPRLAWPSDPMRPIGGLLEVLGMVGRASEVDSPARKFYGLHFEAGHVYATDEARLHWADLEVDVTASIPPTFVARASKVLGGDVHLAATDRTFVLADEDTTVMTSTLASHLPWAAPEGMIGWTQAHAVEVDAGALLDALALAETVADDAKLANKVEVAFTDGELVVTRAAADVGSVRAVAPGSGDWPEPLLLNVAYLRDAVEVSERDTITLRAESASMPVRVDGERVGAIVMSLRMVR
jgi:DNA polymerase III sliding clamp (beta) subunit (PCNA family)